MSESQKSDDVRIDLASDQDHERVVAEIYFHNQFVALVSNDNGVEVIEFPGPGLDESCIARSIPRDAFLHALSIASNRLKE